MAQTFGSQIFGPWYDAIGMAIISCMFFYFSIHAGSLPLALKDNIPVFLLNKKFCITFGIVMAMMSVFKVISTFK